MELRARGFFSASSVPPDKRRDAKIRRQMSAPAMRAFLNIAEEWKLPNERCPAGPARLAGGINLL
jgi:hypothetical protein